MGLRDAARRHSALRPRRQLNRWTELGLLSEEDTCADRGIIQQGINDPMHFARRDVDTPRLIDALSGSRSMSGFTQLANLAKSADMFVFAWKSSSHQVQSQFFAEDLILPDHVDLNAAAFSVKTYYVELGRLAEPPVFHCACRLWPISINASQFLMSQ
jgi:hypothetical protein